MEKREDPFFQQINVWNLRGEEEPQLLETINLGLEDGHYGDDGQALYFTGENNKGQFVEVVVTVPERHLRMELTPCDHINKAAQKMAEHMQHEDPNCETCKEFKGHKPGTREAQPYLEAGEREEKLRQMGWKESSIKKLSGDNDAEKNNKNRT